jgi:hypothetical protein
MVYKHPYKNLKNRKNTKFSYEYRNTYLENVSEFKFLGNVITQNGNLVSCAEALSKKALMYSSVEVWFINIHIP